MTERPREPEDVNPYAPPLSAELGRGVAPLAEGSAPVTSVTFRITSEDLRDARRGMIGPTPGWEGKKPLFYLLLMIVTFVVVYMKTGSTVPVQPRELEPDRGDRPSIWFVFAPLLIIPGTLVGIILIQRFGRWGKSKESPNESTVTIEPGGMRVRDGNSSDTQSSWTMYEQIRETPTMILVLFQNFDMNHGKVIPTAIPIPKRAFATPEAAASFLETARRWHAEAIAAKPSEAGGDAPNVLNVTDHGGDPMVDRNQ